MKKFLGQWFLIVLLGSLFVGFNISAEAAENDSSTFATTVKQDQKGVYTLEVKNIGKADLKKIEGQTGVPATLKKDFQQQKINWSLKELKQGETAKIQLNQQSFIQDKVMPLLGSKTGQGLIGLGALLLVVAILFWVKKKRWTLLLLLLIAGGLSPVAFAAEERTSVAVTTNFTTVEGQTLHFVSQISYETVNLATEDSSTTTDSSEHPGAVPDEQKGIVIAGTAYNADEEKLAEKELTITAGTSSQKITTDQQGFFYFRGKKGQTYQIDYQSQLASAVVANDLKDYQVTDTTGRIDLGKQLNAQDDSAAFVKLNISTVYFEPSEALTYSDNQLTIAGKEDLAEGDVIVVGPKDTYDSGFSLKATSVSYQNGQTIVTGQTPELMEIFQVIHSAEEGVLFGEPQLNLNDGVTATAKPDRGNLARSRWQSSLICSSELDIGKYLKKLDKYADFMNYVSELKAAVSLEGNAKIDVSLLKPIEEQVFAISVIPKVETSVKIGKDKGYEEETIIKENIGNITVPTNIPLLNVNVPLEFFGALKATGELVLNVNTSTEKKLGLAFENGQFNTDDFAEAPKTTFDVSGGLAGEAEVRAGVRPAVQLRAATAAITDLGVELGGKYAIAASMKFDLLNTQFNPDNVDAESSVDLYGSCEMTSPILENFGLEAEIKISGEITRNLQQTQAMSFRRESASAAGQDKIYVQPGEHVVLQAVNEAGDDILTAGDVQMLPFALPSHTISNLQGQDNTISFDVAEDATEGDVVPLKVFQLLSSFLVANKGPLEIIVGQEPQNGNLTGKIADAITEEAIAGANLEFFNGETSAGTATTNAEGIYTASLAKGTYKAIIKADGYITEENTITVNEEETTHDAKLLLIGSEYAGVGTATGTIKDAMTGYGLEGVELAFRRGRNTTTGEVLESTISQSDGVYSVDLAGGNYTMEMTKDGYFQGYANLIVIGEHTRENQDGTLTPNELAVGQYRAILVWGENPSDIDTHFIGRDADNSELFHLAYWEKYIDTAETTAFLDVDDTDSFGPETLTIEAINPALTYDYDIQYYSGDGTLQDSQAKVQVYDHTGLINTFNVPQETGSCWRVFTLKEGKIVPVNQMVDNFSRKVPIKK